MQTDRCRELVGCELGDIDADEKSAIDKASPFRFESKIRIWESRRPQIDKEMVDVLESGEVDTGGGSSDIRESSQGKDKKRSGYTIPPHFESPQRVWPQCFVASYTDL